MVGFGIGQGGLHRRLVDVHGVDVQRTELGRTDGQNAGAAAVVKHTAGSLAGSDPAQAHARGRVRAGAKSQPRVQPDHLPRLSRRLVPGRHDPKFGRDIHRGELRLRQAHPVLLGHRADGHQMATREKVLRHQQRRRLAGCCLGREQGHHARALPAGLGRRHARLAKQGLLGRSLRVSVFHRHTQGVQRIERVAQRFDRVHGGQQDQLEKTHKKTR